MKGNTTIQIKKKKKKRKKSYEIEIDEMYVAHQFESKEEKDTEICKICEILPGKVYLTSVFGASEISSLKKLKISHILNVSTQKECKNVFEKSFKYKRVSIRDFPDVEIKEYFGECHKFISDSLNGDGRVLVHCHAGVSRSSSVVISWLMNHHKTSLKKSFNLVRKSRKVCLPNLGFFLNLLDYEQELLTGKKIVLTDSEKNSPEFVKGGNTIDFFLYSVMWISSYLPKLKRSKIKETVISNNYDVGTSIEQLMKSSKPCSQL